MPPGERIPDRGTGNSGAQSHAGLVPPRNGKSAQLGWGKSEVRRSWSSWTLEDSGCHSGWNESPGGMETWSLMI